MAESLPDADTVTSFGLLLFQVISALFCRPVIFSDLLCPLIMVSLEELIRGSGLCNTDCARQNCRFCRKNGQYKDCYQRYQDFFSIFSIAIPPSKKYDGSLY